MLGTRKLRSRGSTRRRRLNLKGWVHVWFYIKGRAAILHKHRSYCYFLLICLQGTGDPKKCVTQTRLLEEWRICGWAACMLSLLKMRNACVEGKPRMEFHHQSQTHYVFENPNGTLLFNLPVIQAYRAGRAGIYHGPTRPKSEY